MVGRCIAYNRIANIEFLRRVIGRDSDGFEDFLAADDRMGPVWGDIKGRDRNAGSVGDRLRLSWSDER